MTVHIMRIEERVVNCRLDDGQFLDIDRKWLPEEINLEDELDFDVAIASKVG